MREPSNLIYHGTTLANRFQTWLAATRPAFLSASLLPVLVAGALAHANGAAHGSHAIRLFLCLCAIALIHAGANVVNDACDDANGSDTVNTNRIHPFTGGARFIQNGVLTRSQSLWLGVVLLATGSMIGLLLVALTGQALFVIGIIGLVLAVAYSAPPCLVCRSLGDLVIAVTFGVLPVAGVTLVLTGRIPLEAWWIGTGIGCFAAAILWVNSIPDIAADRAAGKLTLPARLGADRAARALSFWFVAGFAVLLAAPIPAARWAVLLAAIPAGLASSVACASNIAKAIPLTIATHAAVGVLLIAALTFAR